jgi:uncharacterized protein DUF997
MSKLLEDYKIREDSRYTSCFREAMISLGIFVAAAVFSITLTIVMTTGRGPQEYGRVLGLPAYVFWGIVATNLGSLLAVVLLVRFVYGNTSLDPTDPSRVTARPDS